jgi:hypothetical protein
LWTDRFPDTGEIKGSAVILEPGKHFLSVTSNYPIEKCFRNREDVTAIQRRFHEIEMTRHNAPLINAWRLDIRILDGQKVPLPELTMHLIQEDAKTITDEGIEAWEQQITEGYKEGKLPETDEE